MMYCEKIYELENTASLRLLEKKSQALWHMDGEEFDGYVSELEELLCVWEEHEPSRNSRAHAVWARQHDDLERLLDMAMTCLGESLQ